MRLRGPSGKVITNKFIRSKLQKKQEKFSYSSSFSTPLLFGDVVWMNNHLINSNVFNRFVTRYKSQVEHVLWQLVLSLKKIQHIEFFIENAKSKVFRVTGVRLRDEDLTGAWYRCVDFDTLYVKLLSTAQLAISIRNFEGLDYKSHVFGSLACNSQESNGLDSNQVMACYRLLDDKAIYINESLALFDVLFMLVKQFKLQNNQPSASPFVFSSGEYAFSFMFNENNEPVLNRSDIHGHKSRLEFKLVGSETSLVLTNGQQTVTICLELVAGLYYLFPLDNQLQVCQGFVQRQMLASDMVLSYEQRRLIFLLVHVLSLNVLVKRKR
jgi:hypothetical protein